MANFNTHLTVAVAASGWAATTLYVVDLITARELFAYTMMGTFGGILPDIDSDNSTATRWVFNFFALILCLMLSILFGAALSLLELWGIMLLGLAVLLFVLRPVFLQCTRHRGIFHSILAGCFFGCAITALAALRLPPEVAWGMGFFCFFGFTVHLLLDEIYSVDVTNVRIKRSFGTALKLFSPKYKMASALMAGAVVLAWTATPSPQPFIERMSLLITEERFIAKLLPEEQWFGILTANRSKGVVE